MRNKYDRYYIRALLIIPIALLRYKLGKSLEMPIVILNLLLIIPTDLCTSLDWQQHCSSVLVHVLIDIVVSQYLLGVVNPSNLLMFSFHLKVIVSIAFNAWVYSVLEKFLKEFWVIRETSEKSFRTFHTMLNENQSETIVLSPRNKSSNKSKDDGFDVIFSNNAFEKTMKRLINKEFPSSLKEFVHENSIENTKQKVNR